MSSEKLLVELDIDYITVNEINAYAGSNLKIASGDAISIEASNALNFLIGADASVVFYESNVEVLSISATSDSTIVSASNRSLTLTGEGASNSTTVSKTTLFSSNTRQVVSTTESAIEFDSPVEFASNLIVGDSIVGYNNLAITGNAFMPTVNIYKTKTPDSSNSYHSQVAYAFHINAYDQLQLVKYDKYGTSNQTATIQNIATFGEISEGLYVEPASNYTALSEFNGLAVRSNGSAVVAGLSPGAWVSGLGNAVYYDRGNVGIGTSSPSDRLTVVGDARFSSNVYASNFHFSGKIYKDGVEFASGGSHWSNNSSNVFIVGSNVAIGKTTAAFALDVNGAVNAAGYCNLLISDLTSYSVHRAPTASNATVTYNKAIDASNAGFFGSNVALIASNAAFFASNAALSAVSESVKLTSRQGGNSSNFGVGGSNNYSVTGVVMQTGVASVTGASYSGLGDDATLTVSFPVAFAQEPIVFASVKGGGYADWFTVGCSSVSSNAFSAKVKLAYDAALSNVDFDVSWIAVGAT